MADEFESKYLPLTLSIETLGGLSTPLVRRGTPLPAKRKQTFSTAVDDQKAVNIIMYFGESPIAAKNFKVASVELSDILEAPRGDPQIEITFEINTKCEIQVTASEKKSGKRITTKIDEAPTHLTNERIQEALIKYEQSQNEDAKQVQQIEARNKSNNLIHRAEKYIQDHQNKNPINSAVKRIEEGLANLGLALNKDNLNDITDKSSKLEQLISADMFGFGDISIFDLFSSSGGFDSKKQSKSKTKSPAAPKAKIVREAPSKKSKQSEEIAKSQKGLLAGGQHFDAKFIVLDLFAQAMKEIRVIDPYIGENVLKLLAVKRDGVRVKIITSNITPPFSVLASDFNRQYKELEICKSMSFHDRFIIIDGKNFYHFGASLEHLGNKTFMFSKLEEPTIVATLEKEWQNVWGKDPLRL